MANMCRKIGVNIYTAMQKANVSLEHFAEYMGYSVREAWSIVEGKIMLAPQELERIASCLETSEECLLDFESESIVPELQYMNEFSNQDNLDKILDLMDEYVEFKEVV